MFLYLLESCVQTSINLNLRFGFYPVKVLQRLVKKEVDSLMKNLEDLIKTKHKLCVNRVFLKNSELACCGYYE